MFGVFWVLRLGFVFNKNTHKKKRTKRKEQNRRESKERKRITFRPDERRVTFKEGGGGRGNRGLKEGVENGDAYEWRVNEEKKVNMKVDI